MEKPKDEKIIAIGWAKVKITKGGISKLVDFDAQRQYEIYNYKKKEDVKLTWCDKKIAGVKIIKVKIEEIE